MKIGFPGPRSRNLLAGCLAGFVASHAATISNPFIWADIPDPSIVRAGDEYYMSHTTMHMAPGVPIMKSSDLAYWKTVGYCYSTLSTNDNMNLVNGKNAYGKGSWASSIRYKDGTFHVLVPSYTTGKTHLYSTTDAAKGPWKEVQFPFYHDPSLHLDPDGRNFVVYGSGDIKLVQLNSTLTGTQGGGINKTIISANAIKSLLGVSNPILVGEGAHIEKINGYYYVFIICWPNAAGYNGRTEIVYRSRTIDGNYEGKVVHSSNGVAQGSVIQDKDGKWWGYLFQDNGSVGRSPWIMPVTWTNDWPVFNNGTSPSSVTMNTNSSEGTGIVTSDNFEDSRLKLEWQWNHNPDNANWSLTQRPGWLRIKTGRVDAQVVDARNTLTQRSFGPKSSGRTVVDMAGMKDGDIAGLVALQEVYGYVGVRKNGTSRSVVMVNANNQVASVNIDQDRVFLRVDMDFTNRTDKATFFYSLDSANWKSIGNTLSMSYKLTHFMGYRFGLFNYATKSAGGVADFDWFKIGANASQEIDLTPKPVAVQRETRPSLGLKTYRWQDSRLSVRFSRPTRGEVALFLFDGRGRLAARLAETSREGEDQFASVATPRLPEGQYLLVATIDGIRSGSWSISLVK
ncbi:MAG: glycosyl hydrolase 43 family protein [Fibrobacteria bacterium]|nr:glycosyl hydrolase 43 family protein [Fibrobacteria bacterium]